MRTTPATISTIIALLEPLISTLVALTPLLGERLSPGGVVGGSLLLGSVLLLMFNQSRSR
jgi:drug/metabolite transporter (DMT)-like permease